MSYTETKIKIASYQDILAHFEGCADIFDPPLDSYVDLKEYSNKIFEKAITFESWHEGRLVGLIAAYFNNLNTKEAYITNVSIHEEFQGFGIASALLDKTINYGQQLDFSKLSLDVKLNNLKAIKFYTNHGFVATGKTSFSYLMERSLIPNKK